MPTNHRPGRQPRMRLHERKDIIKLLWLGFGSLLAGAVLSHLLFELISPEPLSDGNFEGVTIQSTPIALSIHSEAAFVQCYLTINRKFGVPANLSVGETLLPWSSFINEQNVGFDPAANVPDRLMIDCANPVHRAGVFRVPRR